MFINDENYLIKNILHKCLNVIGNAKQADRSITTYTWQTQTLKTRSQRIHGL